MPVELSAEFEAFLAWIEAECADLPPGKRAKRVTRFVTTLQRRAAVPSVREPGRSEAAGAALEAVNRNIVRLLG